MTIDLAWEWLFRAALAVLGLGLFSSLFRCFLCTTVDYVQTRVTNPRVDIHQQDTVRVLVRIFFRTQLTYRMHFVPYPGRRSLSGEVLGTLGLDHDGVADSHLELVCRHICLLCRQSRHGRCTDQDGCN